MKKFGKYTISDQEPQAGNRVICIQKTNFNYEKIEVITEFQAKHKIADTVNWKVIVDEDAVTVEGLLEFKDSQEVTYASHFGGGHNKKLVLTLHGGYRVYDQGEVVLEGMNPKSAIDKYNSI